MSFSFAAGLVDDDSDWEELPEDLINKTAAIETIYSDTEDEDSEKKYLKVLKKQFGHSQFRPMQWKIIRSILEDHRDVSAIMATGYGKSLCYQFPSVYAGGITIVVSPLISLMEDQVLALNMANVPACLLGSAQNKQKAVIDGILCGEYRIVYVTPEFILGDYGSDILTKIGVENIALLAIDEAHCVSKWGHDFRPQYRNLWKLRSILKNVPVLAVTATATPTVQKDISSSLKLKDPLLLCSGFDRPNLYFEVRLRTSSDPYTNIKPCMNQISGSTIIYCISKKVTEEVATNLKVNGIDNVVYHAGLTIKQRKTAHEQFVKDKVKVVVATVAFGMGIDKPDVRTVIHYGCAKDIEGYYQEVGRAGRDGLPAKCYVLYSTSDFNLHQLLRESTAYVSKDFKTHQEQSSALMEKFLNSQTCRRKFIMDHFEDTISDYNKTKKNCCDNCTREALQPLNKTEYVGVDKDGLYNFASDFKLYLDAINACDGKFGTSKYILFIRGSKSSQLYAKILQSPLYGSGKHRSEEWWKIIARLLSAEGFLKKNFQKNATFSYSTISLSQKGEKFLKNCAKTANFELKLPIPADMKKFLTKVVPPPAVIDAQSSKWMEKQNNNVLSKKPSVSGTSSTTTITTESDDPVEKQHRKMLYADLLSVRNNIAHGADVMPYIIASNTALMQMSRLRPTNMEELLSYTYDGLNEVKLKNYGQKFLDCINQFCVSNPSIQSTKPEKTNLSGSSTPDKLTWLSKSSSNSDTPVMNLKQFAFVENKPKLESQASETSTSQNNDPTDFDDKTNSEISDTQFNEIMDFLENDPDETIREADKSVNKNDESQISSTSKYKKTFRFEKLPSSIDENSLKLSNSQNTEKMNDSQDKKRRLSSTEENEKIPKKPTKILSKYLDF